MPAQVGTFFIFMVIIYFLLFSLALPIFMFARQKQKVVRFIPFSLLGSTLLYMPFIAFGAHKFGFYGIIALHVFSMVWGIVKIYKQKINILSFFKPGIVCFLCFVPIVYFITRNSAPMLWDELRLWAAVPKHLFFSGASHIGVNSFIYTDMQNYPFAMPAFQLLLMHMQGFWSENILFFAYAILAGSLFVRFIPNTKASYFAIPLVLALMVLLPQSYANSYEFDNNFYYTSLFIDFFIGFLLAYAFLMLCKNPFKDYSETILFAIVLSILALSKESGIFLVVLLLLCTFGLYAFKLIRAKNYISLLLVLLPFACYFLFQYAIQVAGVKESSDITLPNILTAIQQPTEEQLELIVDYFKSFTYSSMVLQSNAVQWWNLPEFFSPLFAFIFQLLLNLIAIFVTAKEYRKKAIVVSCQLAVFVLLYFVSLLPVYLFKIGYEEYQFASQQRYLSTAYFAQLFFAVYLLLQGVLHKITWPKFGVLLAVFASIALLFPMGEIKRSMYDYELKEGKNHAHTIAREMPGNTKLFLIMNNSSGEDILIHHQMYYALLEHNINLDNTMTTIDWITEIDVNGLAQRLTEFDYCYLYADYEDVFKEQYSLLFATEIEFPKLYKVEKENGSVVLR